MQLDRRYLLMAGSALASFGLPGIALPRVARAQSAGASGHSQGEIQNRAIQRRAVEAVIWGMPAVNYDLMLQEMLKAGGEVNQIVYWSDFLDWKNQTLTPNPTTIYLMPFFDTRDSGPMVLEIPPAEGGSITGSIMDSWQAALEDVGPAGADQGRGGRYLILPPDYDSAVPEGFIVLPSDTNMGYALLRSNVAGGSGDDIAAAVDYGKRVKLYPLAEAANPPTTTFVDATDLVYDSTIPYDVRFFEALNRFVQREPWLERDKVMINQLESLGIKQGQPFDPAPDLREVLEEAASDAHAYLDLRYEALFSPSYYPGGQWALPLAPDLIEGLSNKFTTPGVYPLDDRGTFFSFAFSSIKNLGAGQFYLVTIRDKDGDPLDGAQAYRLSVPANAPAELYWSVTAYDRETHGLIRNMPHPSRGSNTPEVVQNPDGSTDIYFGPAAPAGKESNWIPTDPQRGYELMFRFYGPKEELFSKAWVLPDVEKFAAR